MDSGDMDPVCVVLLTDLCSVFPSEKDVVDLPYIWCKVGNYECEAPFGQLLTID